MALLSVSLPFLTALTLLIALAEIGCFLWEVHLPEEAALIFTSAHAIVAGLHCGAHIVHRRGGRGSTENGGR